MERFHSRPFIFIEELLEFVHFLLVLVLAADQNVLELLLASIESADDAELEKLAAGLLGGNN